MFLSVNSVNQLIFVMVKCGGFFEVRAEFLNIMKTSVSFKGLISGVNENRKGGSKNAFSKAIIRSSFVWSVTFIW
jgi:hypothetical protein